MAGKKVYKLSSRGRRFCAALIDEIIPVFIFLVMIIGLGVLAASDDYYYDAGAAVGGGVAMIFSILLLIAYIVVEIIFYAKSQSVGKAILGMQVVSSKDGKPVGIWWMLLREFIVKPACGSAYLLGYIWILIDKKNRGWHDKILDTYVVDTKLVGEPAPAPQQSTYAAPAAEPVVEPIVEPVVDVKSPTEQRFVELIHESVDEEKPTVEPVEEPVVEPAVEEIPVLEMEPTVEEITVEAPSEGEIKLELETSEEDTNSVNTIEE